MALFQVPDKPNLLRRTNLLYFSRIPKTGSMTFRKLMKDLGEANKFRDFAATMHVPVPLALTTQEERVRIRVNFYVG